jgi:FMN phosphatase YigB (HAD superfamily)
MVGDNLPSDIAGGRAAGMLTIWLHDSNSASVPAEVDLRTGSLIELHRLWLSQRLADPRSARVTD